MDSLGKDLGFTEMDDWYHITVEEIRANGGTGLVARFGYSVFRLLSSVYRDHRWDITRFRVKKRFSCIEMKAAMEEIGRRLGVVHLDDWYGVDMVDDIRGLILDRGSTFSQLLLEAYPDHRWMPWRFKANVPQGYWSLQRNRRIFMDWLGETLQFKRMEDWYSINGRTIQENGGAGLLQHCGGSPSRLVRLVYPEHEWREDRFDKRTSVKRPAPPVDIQLDDLSDGKKALSLVEWMGKHLDVRKMDDWYRVSLDQINSVIPKSFLERYPLENLLEKSYPNHKWEFSKMIVHGPRTSQRQLASMIQNLFPNSDVRENSRLNVIRNDEDIVGSIELDIYLPKEKLAFEYQGEHHYEDIYALGHKWVWKERDEEKRKLCELDGITLVTIPYWWDRTKESLISTIHEHRKDLFPSMVFHAPISENEPEKGIQSDRLSTIMYGEDWNGKQDLNGWWLSEKMDGVRAYWNGEKLISKYGKELMCPPWFIQGFPKGQKLDGELWMGRGQLEELTTLLNSPEKWKNLEWWKSVRYVIFDIPSSLKPHEERMVDLRKIDLPPQMDIVEIVRCNGNDDLLDRLNAVIENGGEGLMAVEPHSLYSPGERTSRLLKVKLQHDDEVQVMEILPTGIYCLQKNGKECIAGCFPQVLENPPSIGSVITVKHVGYYSNGILRHPFFWRERKDPGEGTFEERKMMSPIADWTKLENQRSFFDHLWKDLGFKSMDDMYKITADDIRNRGGAALIDKIHGGSIGKTLQWIYPDHEWRLWLFKDPVPNGFWNDKQNQRNFLDWLGKKVGCIQWSDWYNVKADDFRNNGGSRLLRKYGTMLEILKVNYPQHEWTERESKPAGYWRNLSNQRRFMDELGKTLGFTSMDQWHHMSKRDIQDNGGRGLLKRYRGSPFKLVQAVYPDHPWRFYHL